MHEDRELQIAEPGDVEDLLDQMAASIAPHVGRHTALIGILRRGAPLAHMLADRLVRHVGRRPDICELKLKRYGDDLELLHEHPHLDKETLDIETRGRHLILVDDVLYTGESMMRAAGFLRHAGATRLQIAALARRCGRTMPVYAEFVGCTLDVRPDWVIHCHVPPYEPELGISVAHQEAVRGISDDTPDASGDR